MTPTEILLTVITCLVVIGQLVYWSMAYQREEDRRHEISAQYERREKALLICLREAQNRITAKDLSGYMALQSEDRKSGQTSGSFAMDDEAEAAIAAERRGIRGRNAGSVLNPGTNGVGE